MLHVASPRLRMDTMFTSGVSRVFAVFTIPYVWPDLPDVPPDVHQSPPNVSTKNIYT